MALSITTQDIASSTATGQGGQSIITGTPTPGSFVQWGPLSSYQREGDGFSLMISGTWTGTLQVEASIDNGVSYVPISCYLFGVNLIVSQITGNCVLKGSLVGITHLRVRAIGAMTGTANVIMTTGLDVDTINSTANNTIAALPSATFTRPANTTAYAAGQLVANSTTAGSVVPMSFTVGRFPGGTGMIRRVRLQKSSTSITNAQFRLHLYSALPTPTNGDGGVWLTTGSANYMGSLDINIGKTFSDGASENGAPNIGSEINFALTSGQTIYGLLQALAAYTPASGETFQAALETIQY